MEPYVLMCPILHASNKILHVTFLFCAGMLTVMHPPYLKLAHRIGLAIQLFYYTKNMQKLPTDDVALWNRGIKS